MKHARSQFLAVALVAASVGTLGYANPAQPRADMDCRSGELARQIGMMGVAWREPPR